MTDAPPTTPPGAPAALPVRDPGDGPAPPPPLAGPEGGGAACATGSPPTLPLPRSRGGGSKVGAWRRRAAVAAIAGVAGGAGYVAATTPLDAFGIGGTAAPGVGMAAPTFTLPSADGGTIDLKAFRGRPVILNFWATWCTPCRAELPELELAYRDHRDDGLAVIAVSLDDAAGARDVPEFLGLGSPATGAYTFPVALDVTQSQMRRYRLLGVPSTFFLDRAGVVRAVQPGVMNREVIARNLAAILRPA